MEIHQKTNQYESKDAFNRLYILLFIILLIGWALKECEEKPETRTINHIWQGKGWTDSLNTTSFDTHCRTNQTK